MKLQATAARVSGSSKPTENKVASRVSFTLQWNDLSSPSPSKLIGVVRSDSKSSDLNDSSLKKVSFSPVDDVYEYDQEDPTPNTQVAFTAKEMIIGSNPIDEVTGSIPKANVEVQEQEGVQKTMQNPSGSDGDPIVKNHTKVTFAEKMKNKEENLKVNFRFMENSDRVNHENVVIPIDSVNMSKVNSKMFYTDTSWEIGSLT